jgi:septum formation protein
MTLPARQGARRPTNGSMFRRNPDRYAGRMSIPVVVLASASPRRSELLRQIGVPHLVRPVDVDESIRSGEEPVDYVRRIGCDKATSRPAVAAEGADLPVLGSDTAVVLDGEVFGKPRDREDAARMLERLSGRTHEVHTAVALAYRGRLESRLSTSEVTFRALRSQEIDDYCASGEPADKAGAYAIQGFAAVFITRISGSYSGIMGLPLYETAELLRLAGVIPRSIDAVRRDS